MSFDQGCARPPPTTASCNTPPPSFTHQGQRAVPASPSVQQEPLGQPSKGQKPHHWSISLAPHTEVPHRSHCCCLHCHFAFFFPGFKGLRQMMPPVLSSHRHGDSFRFTKRRFPHLPGQMILLAPVKIHFKFETPNIFSLAESYSDPRQCGLKRGD